MTKLHEFIVGIIFVSAMAVLGYFTIVRGDYFDKREYYSSTVIFDDVEGLEAGNKVLINGVDAGSVTGIELMSDSKVLVTVRLFRKFSLYENYRVVLKNQTALGGKIVAINPGAAEFEGRYYRPVESMKNLSGIAIGDPLSKISEVIDENREELKFAIRNFSEFSEKINKGEGTIAKLVNKGTMHESADKLLGETENLIKELRDAVEDSREQAPVTSFIRAALTAF